MNITRFGKPLAAVAIAATAALALSSCAANEGGAPASNLKGTFKGAGASSMDAAQQAWIAAFQTSNPGVTINYEPSGSGAGRTAFISGAVAYAGSDAALTTDELGKTFAACAAGTKPFEVPAYISPIAVAFNVPGVTELNLDAATLAGIFAGQITKWDDPKIAALNSGAKLPSATITAVHRSDNSGTTTNFSDYLFQTAPAVWTNKASGDFPTAYKGEAAKGNAGVADAVANGTNTIGYIDASKLGKMTAAKIKVGDKFVAYTPAAAAAVVAGSPAVSGREATDMAISINRKTTNSAEYPLVLVSYVIGCNTYADAATAALVKPYLQYILSPAGQKVSESAAGGAALSSSQSDKALAIVNAIK